MTRSPLDLSRAQILSFRRRVQGLDQRRPFGPEALQRAAWAGLQDSMPRAALLSIHARLADTPVSAWEDPSLVQVWGPRYSAYVVATCDVGLFTRARLPDAGTARQLAEDIARRLHDFLDGRAMSSSAAARGVGVRHPNVLRYAAPTGTVLIKWDGARQPTIWTVPVPEVDPHEARLALARRYLHFFGPTTPESFAAWAGISSIHARLVFEALRESLVPARTPIGEGYVLADDAPAQSAAPPPSPTARLLPSGDTYFLLQGADRELLVPDAELRQLLWTPRVWPGAVLLDGEIVGTWRRAEALLTIDPWRELSSAERDTVEAEATALPLPGLKRPISVRLTTAKHPS